jgi:hypothetical protein
MHDHSSDEVCQGCREFTIRVVSGSAAVSGAFIR